MWSELQESSGNTVLSCLSEARIGSANHGEQIDVCQMAASGKKLYCSAVFWPSCCKQSANDVHIPGEHVSNISPDSAGCINLSMRPRERMEGEKMTGRFV